MIWQRLINRLSGQPRKSIRDGRINEVGRGNQRRRLKLESLQKRELLASDLGAISGVAFVDADGDSTVDVGETLLQNVEVRLFVDENQDGQQDGGDTFVGLFTTGADGAYRFTNLDGDDDDIPVAPVNQTDDGAYVLTFTAAAGGVQDPAGNPVVGVQLPDDLARVITDDTGTTAAVIDQFLQEQPGQPITQNTAGNTTTSSSGALTSGGDVIGDERDVEVFVDSATSGDSQFSVVTGTTQLVFSNGGDVEATLLVQYDGVDADGAGLNRDVNGLANADLTDGEDLNVGGLLLAVRGDQVVTDGMEVRVFTNGTDFSIATVDLPSNIAASEPLEIFVPFTDFVADAGGTGAVFTDVGAIEVFVDGVNSNGGAGAPSLDLFVSVLETQKSTEYVTNAAASVPLILGGEVFVDNGAGSNQALQNNGIKDGTEPVFLAPGADKVTVQLFDVDPSGGGDTPIASSEVDLAVDANR